MFPEVDAAWAPVDAVCNSVILCEEATKCPFCGAVGGFKRTTPRKVVQCRSRSVTLADDRYVALNAQRHGELTACELFQDLPATLGTIFSRQTAERRIAEKGFYSQ
ncbi:hypothetical protein AVEN_18117-1 [Araneus ventricosus]|uniref:Uncharacterized protein n=1 Tax=Araneus ventricosus TaxID=182803 RepID=A0A4Y2AJS7_ARAVE|nr:hypothetical protein AVEN_18117-1 [Araneus ventricosus]